METHIISDEDERLARQRKMLFEKFGIEADTLGDAAPSAVPPNKSAEYTEADRFGVLGKTSCGQAQGQRAISPPSTPSVVQIAEESQDADLHNATPDPQRDYGLRLLGSRFHYRASLHEQARASRELFAVTPVTAYASPLVESSAHRIAVHDHWIAYAVKNHIRLLDRLQIQRALLKGHEGPVEELSHAPQCPQLLLSSAADGSVIFWRLEGWDGTSRSPSEHLQWRFQLSNRRSSRIALSPDGRWIAFTEDARVHVLPVTADGDVESRQHTVIPTTHEVRDIAFVAKAAAAGWLLVLASAHGMVHIAEPEHGTIVGEFCAHSGAPVERVLSLAPQVLVTATSCCTELWYWRLVGLWAPPQSGSVQLLARCSFHEYASLGPLATDPEGEFLFLANHETRQLFVLHHASGTFIPDYLVQVPLRYSIASFCATRSVRRERDLDEKSGLPQLRENVFLDLWCMHEKCIQGYHVRREHLAPAGEAPPAELSLESSNHDENYNDLDDPVHDDDDDDRHRAVRAAGDDDDHGDAAGNRVHGRPVLDVSASQPLEGLMSTSPPVLVTHTHTLYEAFRKIAPQLKQRSSSSRKNSAIGVGSAASSSPSPDAGDAASSLPVDVRTLAPESNGEAGASTPKRGDFPDQATNAGMPLFMEKRILELEARLTRIEQLLHELMGTVNHTRSETASTMHGLLQQIAKEHLVPALMRTSAETATSLSRALDEAIRVRFKPVTEQLEQALQRTLQWPTSGPVSSAGTTATTLVPTGYTAPTPTPREQILRWLHQQPMPDEDRAFHAALNLSDLETLVWLCKQCSPELVCEKLSQPVLLSLVQQLGFDLRTHLECKLSYLEEAVPLIQPKDPIIARHMEPTMRQLVHNLDEQVLHAGEEVAPALRTRARLLRKVATLLLLSPSQAS